MTTHSASMELQEMERVNVSPGTQGSGVRYVSTLVPADVTTSRKREGRIRIILHTHPQCIVSFSGVSQDLSFF